MRQVIAAVLAAAGLVACAAEPPPAPRQDAAMRAPTVPADELLVAVPGVASVPRVLVGELARGGPAVCLQTVEALLDPADHGLFRLLLRPPGILVTRDSILRRTEAPPGGPELALDRANNGRCDYVFRSAPARG